MQGEGRTPSSREQVRAVDQTEGSRAGIRRRTCRLDLKIEESKEENPLERENFDADDFTSFAQGIDRISGGNPQEVVASQEAREMLGLPTDEDGSEATEAALEAEMAELDEEDEQIVEQFAETYGEPAVPDGGTMPDDVESDE